MGRYLITQSLLSAWKYQFNNFYDVYEDGEKAEQAFENAHESFLSALRREKIATTDAMQRGIDFEDLVVLIANNAAYSEIMTIEKAMLAKRGTAPKRANTKTNWEKWYAGASEIADIVRGGVFQPRFNAPITVGQTEYLLHGRFDALKQGVIYDIKFASRYEYGNFFESSQHPMYFALVPEAHTYSYLIYREYEGVYTETYRREETRDISDIIAEFEVYLSAQGLTELYREKWAAL